MSNTYNLYLVIIDGHNKKYYNIFMELRELRYFLAVAREESISRAAESLFITQPNLSRQMQNLERETGQKLFIRGNRKVSLTPAGMLLRKRAEEILELHDKTFNELNAPTTEICGDIYIGGGESYAMQIIAKAARAVRDEHPAVRFHLFSGDSLSISEFSSACAICRGTTACGCRSRIPGACLCVRTARFHKKKKYPPKIYGINSFCYQGRRSVKAA